MGISVSRGLYLALVVAFVFFGRVTNAGETRKITIVAKVPPSTSAKDLIYVTGNIPELCSWNPKCHILRPMGDRIYRVDLDLPARYSAVEFKITRGSWETEAAGANCEPYHNYYFDLNRDKSQAVMNIFNWKDGTPLGITGDVRVIPDFYSPQLGNTRPVRIWLPPEYEMKPGRRFPVIYAHDGQNMFDPRPSNGGVDWGVDEALSALIANGQTSGAIVVGMDFTKDRFPEYDYTQRGGLYARFIIETVKPYIDAHFRTLPGRDTTFTMGSSMGALISASLLWKYPEVFSKAAALSLPAFILDRVIYKIFDSSPLPSLPIRLYIDHGDFGGDAKYPAPAREFVSHLVNDLRFPETSLLYRVFPFGDHFEADWARRVDIPLLWLLSGLR